ncbi:MAG: AprI/Inh family metalloprotease inhibitor [Beijerinckiaceae bacterium]
MSVMRWHTVGLTSVLAIALTACESSGRLSDLGGSPAQRVTQPVRQQTFTPAPSVAVQSSPLPPPVTSQPLPPPSGANPSLGGLPAPAGNGVPSSSGLPPIGSSVPIDPEPYRPQPRLLTLPPVAEPQQSAPQPQPQVASRPEPVPQASSGAPSRTSVTGNWTAREAAGGTCKMLLSGAPTLDLYKASTSGCQSRELQRVSAWELRGDEIYLYEPGGGVAARLKQSGRGFDGSAAKTGAPVSLSK